MKTVLKWTGIVLGVLLVVLVTWGVVVEPRLIDTEDYTVQVPDLPAAWEGAEVAVVADYQIGMWWANTGTMHRITERLVEARPAAVLLAGDFIYKAGDDPSDEIAKAVEVLAPLAAAGIPTFAVLGNHDYSLNYEDDPKDVRQAERLSAALAGAGVRVLENEAVALERSGSDGSAAALWVAGIGSEWAGNARPEEALRGVPPGAARVVFMHNPASFERVPAGTAPLAVAGHTHGGQIIIPGTPSWSWLAITAEDEPHADGWIEPSYGQPGNRLYVNRGIGFSAVPMRINAPPEVTFFRLVRGPAAPR